MPLVSVLTTSYNRADFIGEAIESVLASSFEDFEYIIVDDRSTDDTYEIAKSYEARDPRVRVYQNEQNLGDYPNRNKAASYASGKYLKYVDADDHVYPTGVEVLVSMMEMHPDVGYGLCSLPQKQESPFPIRLTPRDAYLSHFMGTPVFHKAPLSAIINRDAFEKVGGFPARRMSSDYEMWLKLSRVFPVLLMPDGVVWYREHDSQEMNEHSRFIGQYIEITLAYLGSPDCPLNELEVNTAIARVRLNSRQDALRWALKGKASLSLQIHKAAKLSFRDYFALCGTIAVYPFRKLFR